MTTRNPYLNYGWMVTENGPIYTTFYMRLQKQSVCRTFTYFSYYKHGDSTCVKKIMPRASFADCNKLKIKRSLSGQKRIQAHNKLLEIRLASPKSEWGYER